MQLSATNSVKLMSSLGKEMFKETPSHYETEVRAGGVVAYR